MASVSRFAPPLAIMALIWFLSDQPDLSSGLGDWDLLLRKLAHMTVYGALMAAWWRATGPWPALAITLGWAALDEWHQTWVAGRHGTPIDWGIDALGAGIASALIVRRLRRAPPPGADRPHRPPEVAR